MNTEVVDNRIDLYVEREIPGRAWPSGEWLYDVRFSFPLRCREAVLTLAGELEDESPNKREALTRKRQRKVLWP